MTNDNLGSYVGKQVPGISGYRNYDLTLFDKTSS